MFETEEHISQAEGALYEDILIPVNENDTPIRIHSVPDSINTLSLVSGRMPEKENECVVDADYFDEDIIGPPCFFR